MKPGSNRSSRTRTPVNPSSRPTKRRWRIHDAFSDSQGGGSIEIAGLDWGGDGPIALLHHPNGFCAATWGLVAEQLCTRYRVIAVDARGHGDSDSRPVPEGYQWDYLVSDLGQVATRLLEETGQAAIEFGIGSSLGGIITAAAEALHPGLFRLIAMLDPPIHPDEALRHELNLELPTIRPNIADQARKRSPVWPSRDTARQAWRDKPVFSAWQPRAFELYLQEGFRDRDDGSVELKCHPHVEATIFETAGSLDTFEFAPRVAAPVLLIRAGQGFFPPVIFEHLAGLFPNCTYRVVDAGHLLPMESPDLVLDLLDDFASAQ
ncbi:MAG: alpha/beta hydrolase [Gammaproteobacteria bacterium]|nr:alpha/beta hydrolase [Gammaproteobacteria bacterium]